MRLLSPLTTTARRWPVIATMALVATAGLARETSPEPPEPTPETAAESAPEPTPEATPEPVLGAPAAFGRDVEREIVHGAAGSELHQAAARRSPVVARLDADAELEVTQRRGPWARVRWQGLYGWLLLDEPAAGDDTAADDTTADDPADVSPAANDTAVASELPASLRSRAGADPAELERARAELEPAKRSSREIGGYRLESDVDDPELLDRLTRIVGHLDRVFAERYGVTPPAPRGEAVVIFARERAYRAFAGVDLELPAVDVVGHAHSGLAALTAAQRSPAQVAILLVHEVGHLIVRRALGRELPVWLEEGLANDLAYSRIDDDGRLLPGTLNNPPAVRIAARTFAAADGYVAFAERRIGGRTARGELLAHRHRRPSLERLIGLDADVFRGDERRLHYAMSAFFVRFLLDGDPDLADRFRVFLQAAARGDRADDETLGARLGHDWDQLDPLFERWLRKDSGKTP